MKEQISQNKQHNKAGYTNSYFDKKDYDGIDPMHDTIREPLKMIKQNSSYENNNKCAPDNNIFFEEKSNPLSSKGN